MPKCSKCNRKSPNSREFWTYNKKLYCNELKYPDPKSCYDKAVDKARTNK